MNNGSFCNYFCRNSHSFLTAWHLHLEKRWILNKYFVKYTNSEVQSLSAPTEIKLNIKYFICNLFLVAFCHAACHASAAFHVPNSLQGGGAGNSVISLKPPQTSFFPCQPFCCCLVLIHCSALLSFYLLVKHQIKISIPKRKKGVDMIFDQTNSVTRVWQDFPPY